jgi:hypothetical protein
MTSPAAPAPAPPAAHKSESVAVLLSLGVTTGGLVTLIAADSSELMWVGLAGMYLGPSTGQWYAGEHGGLGLGLRALGAVGAVYGLSLALGAESDCFPDEPGCQEDRARADRQGTVGGVLMIGGAGLWIGSTIADVIFAKRAAERWNKRHAVSISPTAYSSGSARMPGLVISGRF